MSHGRALGPADQCVSRGVRTIQGSGK
jgi:hypothetical protein